MGPTPNLGRCEIQERGARCAFRVGHEGSHLMVGRDAERPWIRGPQALPHDEWIYHQETRGSPEPSIVGGRPTLLETVWGTYWNEELLRTFVRNEHAEAGDLPPAHPKRRAYEVRVAPDLQARNRPPRRAPSRPSARGSTRGKGGQA